MNSSQTLRNKLVSNTVWSAIALAYRLDEDLLLGGSAERDGARTNQKIIADTFEAYVGALWSIVQRSNFRSPFYKPFMDFIHGLFSFAVFPWVDRWIIDEQERVLQNRLSKNVKALKRKRVSSDASAPGESSA